MRFSRCRERSPYPWKFRIFVFLHSLGRLYPFVLLSGTDSCRPEADCGNSKEQTGNDAIAECFEPFLAFQFALWLLDIGVY